MNCKELKIKLCYGCENNMRHGCSVEHHQRMISSYDNFDKITEYYSDHTYYFLTALEITNLQWYERLIKLMVLK